MPEDGVCETCGYRWREHSRAGDGCKIVMSGYYCACDLAWPYNVFGETATRLIHGPKYGCRFYKAGKEGEFKDAPC